MYSHFTQKDTTPHVFLHVLFVPEFDDGKNIQEHLYHFMVKALICGSDVPFIQFSENWEVNLKSPFLLSHHS